MTGRDHRSQPRRRRRVENPLEVFCVKCGAKMAPAHSEPKNTYGHLFERKAYQCGKCSHVQTYTMGNPG